MKKFVTMRFNIKSRISYSQSTFNTPKSIMSIFILLQKMVTGEKFYKKQSRVYTFRKSIKIILSCINGILPRVVFAGLFATTAGAQPTAGAKLPVTSGPMTHPWQVPSPLFKSEAYFTNLKDGAQVEMPYRVTFGLSGGWGLAPIAKPTGGKSGHHHLLIDESLPMNFEKALPFNNKYLHFGKGQMETVLNFEPGTYSLRLLLADNQHLLHLVYSKPIKITVTRKNTSTDPKTLIAKNITFLNLPSNGVLTSPFRLQFHASGYNIAQPAQLENDTGHFRLTLTPQTTGKSVEINFFNGETEAWFAPPKGAYTLSLNLMSNTQTDKQLVESATATVQVN
jgi:hypothetical protein